MLKKGRKVNYIDSNNYVAVTQEQNFNLENAFSQIPDTIRYFSKNFFTIKNGNLVKQESENSLFNIEFNNNTINLIANKNKFMVETLENGILRKVFDPTGWETFLIDNVPPPEQVFFDHYLDFFEPINLTTANNEIESGAAFINREFVYNFYSPKFETLVTDTFFNVNYIPSIFNLINDTKTDNRTVEENINLSLGGFIPSNNVDSLTLAKKIDDNVAEYFNLFTDAFNNPETNLIKRTIFENQNLFLINKDKLSQLSKTNFIPFPFYLELKFTNLAIHKTDFTFKLQENDEVFSSLISFIASKDFFNSSTSNFIYPDNQERTIKIYDLKNWLTSNTQIVAGADQIYSAGRAIQFSDVVEFIKNNLKNKTRNYHKILNETAHTEILFYKIEKRQFENSPQPIQTFIIIPTETELVKFIDTQIKYGSEFFYKIFAYTLVIGNEYQYSPYSYGGLEREDDLTKGRFKINVLNKPTYKILEILYANFSGAIYEAPLTKPEVYPILDQNTVRFILNQPMASSFEEFNAVESSETALFESIKTSQENDNPSTIYSVTRNNRKAKLQIYRTTNRPVSFLSMQGKKYKTLSLQENENSFIDNLVPNVTYYYLFRFLNEHDIPSNTSQIYKITLNNDEGTLSLSTEMIDLHSKPKQAASKNMKKYLLIRPSIIQTQPKFPFGAKIIDEINFGARESSVWGKKFKVRIKSKNTNRILEFDINTEIDKKKN